MAGLQCSGAGDEGRARDEAIWWRPALDQERALLMEDNLLGASILTLVFFVLPGRK